MNRRACSRIIHGAVLTALLVTMLPGTADAQRRSRRTWRPRRAVYPFARYLDPFTANLPDETPFDVFVAPDRTLSPDAADADNLWGLNYRGRTYLLALSPHGWWRTRWHYRSVDAETWAMAPQPYLLLSSMPKAVYEIDIKEPTGASADADTPLYVAWPTNAIPADRTPPAGAVHAEVIDSGDGLQLHAWGYAYDALQAGLGRSALGIDGAWLRIDRQRYQLALDQDGAFDVSVPIRHAPRGVHNVSLYASDHARRRAHCIDTEYASEYGWPLSQAPDAGTIGALIGIYLTYQSYGSIDYGIDNFWLFDDSVETVAIATPQLDSQGLLILDGSASVNPVSHEWTVEAVADTNVYEMSGQIVGTEDIPAGLYYVTLTCRDETIPGDSPNGATSLWLVIPPRVSLAARAVAGSLHIRWVPELVGRQWQWVMYLGGHLFDEVGTTVLGHGPDNLEAWAQIGTTTVDLPLDAKGHFTGRYVAGATVAPEYEITLHARTLDDDTDHEPDYRFETVLTIFPPWNMYFRRTTR